MKQRTALLAAAVLLSGCLGLDQGPTRGNHDSILKEHDCKFSFLDDLVAGKSMFILFSSNGSSPSVRIDINVEARDGFSFLMRETQPMSGTTQEILDSTEFHEQLAILGTEFGTFVIDIASGSQNRSEAIEADAITQHFDLQPGQNLGLTIQQHGDVSIHLTTHDVLPISCTKFEPMPKFEGLMTAEQKSTPEHTAMHGFDVDREFYMATACAIRFEGLVMIGGESLSIQLDPNPGQQFGNSYAFSAAESISQPAPYGVCFFRQGLAEFVEVLVGFDGASPDSSVHVFAMSAVSPSKLDLPEYQEA